MHDMKISLFGSAIRTNLWPALLTSLESNTIEYEVIFAGPVEPDFTYPKLKHILTSDIKPAQCYEVARRGCQGELVMWIADDCEFSERLLDKIYLFFCLNKVVSHKDIVSVSTNENKSNNNLNDHRFFGFNINTPLMAPLGVMYRKFLNEIGGFDRRFICGQYENQCVMMACQRGATVHKFEEGHVKIDHLEKHGTGTKFWSSYQHDREILENSWVIGGYKPPVKKQVVLEGGKHVLTYPIVNREVSKIQLDAFEPYDDKDLLTVSQSYTGIWG